MLDTTLNIFRAIGEETRLRVMVLLARGELSVTEIAQILGQSQPRVSRHLKILADAGLVERFREGAWTFYRAPLEGGVTDAATAKRLAIVREALAGLLDERDRVIERDRERFEQSRQARAAAAAAYFEANAAEWDRVRQLHLPDKDIEAQLRDQIGDTHTEVFVDLGVGAGRMLEVFADIYSQGVGIDLSHNMLSLARANLERAGVNHAQLRQGDLYALPLDNDIADIVCIHQVLHFLTEPEAAIAEAARILRPGGRLLISDFAPHGIEFLREAHAHRRLGFADNEIAAWCAAASLDVDNVETLSPTGSEGEQLTVKIWSCRAEGGLRQSKVA
ncbi:MAG: metalloregulator ArsR/SmtB family transcription factor [Pseudomonadota bacterium]